MKRLAIAISAIILPISMSFLFKSNSSNISNHVKKKSTFDLKDEEVSRQNISIKLIY